MAHIAEDYQLCAACEYSTIWVCQITLMTDIEISRWLAVDEDSTTRRRLSECSGFSHPRIRDIILQRSLSIL
jgi:hypothetical protein